MLIVVAATVAACGGSNRAAPPASVTETAAASSTAAPVAATAACGASGASLLDLIGGDGQTVSTPLVLVSASQDVAAGRATRISLGLLGKDGSPIIADQARIAVYLAPDVTSAALGPFNAGFEKMEAPEVKLGDSTFHGVYPASVTVPTAGGYFVAACFTVAGKPTWASGSVEILDQEQTFPIGAKAPESDTPTLASTNGDLKQLTTADPPDLSLLKYSVAGSLRDHAPFALVFATPAFCVSRMCGPVVGVVQAVQHRMKDTKMRFIHVEIYQDNDPAKGYNEWVNEWQLPSEPWVFVVDRTGAIRTKFEGPLGIHELERAARAALR